jgi:hypothetical protein
MLAETGTARRLQMTRKHNAVMPALRFVPAAAFSKFSKGAIPYIKITALDDRSSGWAWDTVRIDLVARI